jgi:hypothetical protein
MTVFTLAGARDALKAKKISSQELTAALVAAVEAARPLNAYVTETPEKALAMAKASDARLARGEGGALEGLPLAIKDLFCTKGVRTTAGSKILGNFVPPMRPAPMVRFSIPGGRATPTPIWSRAVPRAVRPPPSPPVSAWPRPAPTPAARSASPPPSPARSA